MAPRLLVEVVRAAHAGDADRCQRLHAEVFELTRIYTQGIGLAGIYAAAARLGLVQNVVAEPWLPVSDADLQRIEAILQAHDLQPLALVR